MSERLAEIVGLERHLIVVAAPAEARAVMAGFGLNGAGDQSKDQPAAWDWPLLELAPGVDLVETGIGKVNAAAAVVHRAGAGVYGAVINLGVCGALPVDGKEGMEIGGVVLASSSMYADEGLQSERGFATTAEMGFALGPFEGAAVPAHAGLLDALAPMADRVGVIATVSTCSGTDELARRVVERTGAIAEAMEGAAIAHVLARLMPRLPFAELRVVSNTTGDRSRQQWDLKGALARLSGVVARIADSRTRGRTV